MTSQLCRNWCMDLLGLDQISSILQLRQTSVKRRRIRQIRLQSWIGRNKASKAVVDESKLP